MNIKHFLQKQKSTDFSKERIAAEVFYFPSSIIRLINQYNWLDNKVIR